MPFRGRGATQPVDASSTPRPDEGAVDSIDHWASLEALVHGAPPPPPPRAELLLAGIDSDKQGAAIRVGPHKLLVGRWGDGRWCDLNVSGASPAYPAPPAAGGLGGQGGLVCMELPLPPPSRRPSSQLVLPLVDSLSRPGTADSGHWRVQQAAARDVNVASAMEQTDDDRPAITVGTPPPAWWSVIAGLYDVESDPRELQDLQHARPDLVASLHARLLALSSSAIPSIHMPRDPNGTTHANRTGCWGPWR